MVSRRVLLGALTSSFAAAPLLALGETQQPEPAKTRVAKPARIPPKATISSYTPAPLTAAPPETWTNPDEALGRLKQGNAIFARRGASMALPSWTRINDLSQAEKPFAVVVGCSDSRTAPELIFDCTLGELFVIRVAGPTVDPIGLGSILYAVEQLGAPLIVVLGHSQCGAVNAAVDMVTKHSNPRGALYDMALPIVPAVLKANEKAPADLLDASVHENVRITAERLRRADPLFIQRIAERRLKIVSACYSLATAQVEFDA